MPNVGRGAPRRRRPISPITWRILAVNLLALAFLFAGMIFIGEYRRGLIAAELKTLNSEARLFAAALAESAIAAGPGGEDLIQPLAQQIIRRLTEASGTRARLFAADGSVLADSQQLLGRRGAVSIDPLPPPPTGRDHAKEWLVRVERLFSGLWSAEALPLYDEGKEDVRAQDFAEVARALTGEPAQLLRVDGRGDLVLSVAVPVQRYKTVVGALMMSKGSQAIDQAVLKVRFDIFKWFLVALAVTVLLSIYLAQTISRPLARLAAAAERVRRDRNSRYRIPAFRWQRDEIGELAQVLREMTEALWQRMDAIERFAADVSHEIKNPLTSLRSAVETASRVNDAERRDRLMAIIRQDVDRLDRLITDIAEASRVDAEMSRAEAKPVNLGSMMETLAEVSEPAAQARDIALRVHVDGSGGALITQGLEDRLVQVFRNLIANALSFSPPGGTITLTVSRKGRCLIAEVVDEGPGVPEGKEEKIFERFYSERPQGERFGDHSGLGLSISKQIVEAHDGRIYAENRRRTDGSIAGARFVVELPC
jgi:two-component system sensor histidine kinase ChvG